MASGKKSVESSWDQLDPAPHDDDTLSAAHSPAINKQLTTTKSDTSGTIVNTHFN